jgi:ABC-2 type transport system permease protein
VITGVIMGVLGMLMMCLAIGLLTNIPFYLMLMIIFTGLIAIVFSNLFGIIIDLYNPKLKWDNEQKAVKQNVNVLISMLFSVLAGALGVILVVVFELKLVEAFCLLVALFGVIDIVLYRFLSKKGAKLFGGITY